MCRCADEHYFRFLQVELEKVDEMPVINGISAFLQVVKLIGDFIVSFAYSSKDTLTFFTFDRGEV